MTAITTVAICSTESSSALYSAACAEVEAVEASAEAVSAEAVLAVVVQAPAGNYLIAFETLTVGVSNCI